MADLLPTPDDKPPPPPPGGAAMATWNGQQWVAGALAWNGTAWAIPGTDPSASPAPPKRLRLVDKALLACLIVAGALLIAAAWTGIQRWFWGNDGDTGSSGYGTTFAACLAGAGVLLVACALLAVARMLTSRKNG